MPGDIAARARDRHTDVRSRAPRGSGRPVRAARARLPGGKERPNFSLAGNQPHEIRASVFLSKNNSQLPSRGFFFFFELENLPSWCSGIWGRLAACNLMQLQHEGLPAGTFFTG